MVVEMPLGAEHGFALQEKVAGVQVPSLQLKDDLLAVYPLAQAGVQTCPWVTLEAPKQDGLAAFEMPLGAPNGPIEHHHCH